MEEHHLRIGSERYFLVGHGSLFSHLKPHQPLIVVFGEFVRTVRLWIKVRDSLTLGTPRILFSDPPPPTLSELFHELKMVTDTPSEVSNPQRYRTLQWEPQQRILDDRPTADRFIPPISLLYDGFGYFDDVLYERRPVPGEKNILEVELWNKVDTFADRMAEFYRTDAERRGAFLDHLERMFRARRDPHAVGEIIAVREDTSIARFLGTASAGHTDGAHGAMVFCTECKNELSNISCEPSAELVSRVARSFKERLDGEHRALFHGWRVPALGVTLIGEQVPSVPYLHHLTRFSGPFVQFFGIVMLAPQMRVVPLTPMLPLATPINDQRSRQTVFLASKAASIVLAKIQADVKRLIQETPRRPPWNCVGSRASQGSRPSSRHLSALTSHFCADTT